MPPLDWAVGKSEGHFLKFVFDMGEPRSLWVVAISGLVVLGSVRRQAEHDMKHKLVNSMPPGSLHQLLLPGFIPV